MEKYQYGFTPIISVIVALGLIAFALCVVAEFNKSKKEDLRFSGKQCSLPGSRAFGLGMAALVCVVIAHAISNIILCTKLWSTEKRGKCKPTRPSIPTIFLSISWISFGVAVVLIGAATSMNRRQPLGDGWLDGECYIVKDGVFIGSGILTLMTASSAIISAVMTVRKSHVEQGLRVPAQFIQLNK